MSVMSAVVAFNGFPGQSIQDPIGSVPVLDRQAPLAAEKHPANAAPAQALRSGALSARHTSRRHDHVGSAKAPVAHANPLVHRQNATHKVPQQPASSSTPAVTVPDTSSVTGGVTDRVPAAPSVPPPDTLLQPSPVTLPGGKTLPADLPVNTSAVSGAADGLLGP
jgi:hypothetical protein